MKRILGYADPWSAAAGDVVVVHVGAVPVGAVPVGAGPVGAGPVGGVPGGVMAPQPYQVDVVRVVSGDADGLGLDLRPVASPIDGVFEATPQATQLGSAIRVDRPAPVAAGEALELALWIWPTTPLHGRQGLIGRSGGAPDGGFGLEIGADGHAAFRFGDARVASPLALVARRWTHLVAGFDPVTNQLSLRQSTKAGSSIEADVSVAAQAAGPTQALAALAGPLWIGAIGGDPAGAHFNGKIAQPAPRRHAEVAVAAAPGRTRPRRARSGRGPCRRPGQPAGARRDGPRLDRRHPRLARRPRPI
jgi:hypothetical protein